MALLAASLKLLVTAWPYSSLPRGDGIGRVWTAGSAEPRRRGWWNMLRRIFASGSRSSAGGIIVFCVVALVAVSSDAQARRARAWDGSKYAAIVIDNNTDRVLFARNADSLRYPASLTKMMTLYMLFAELESGRMNLATRLSVSAHAAAQAPSKLGLKPGSTISVRDAILALVTKSANDVAAVIAENIAGSESKFAARMTARARALGMSRTTFRNASGLPDSEQRTTARDMARLAQALMDDFPKQFVYFKTRSFKYNGRSYRNHNRLLGRVGGVDGIKTGYTRASGFNLATTARRGQRRLVAVVMGGPTGAARNARMTELLSSNFPRASTQTRIARIRLPDVAPLPPRRPGGVDAVALASAAAPLPVPQAAVKPQVLDTAETEEKPAPAEAAATPLLPALIDRAKPQVAEGDADAIGTLLETGSLAYRDPERKTTVLTASAPAPDPVAPDKTITALIAERLREPSWLIQIGAYNDEEAARERLAAAQDHADMLRGHLAYTEPVESKSATLYRARFAGFDRIGAEAACKTLKKAKFGCLALPQ